MIGEGSSGGEGERERVETSFSPIRSIKTLIHNTPKHAKQYIQASRFDSHPISASSQEQFVTLEIPPEFPKEWQRAGYSHIHFGAIRLALNYHGVEGKPIVARIALLIPDIWNTNILV
ncbi:hypothetical protein J1N35_032443 [Gossypium stocksii]|uniref:Uncharacterized protein n=1 Tax=Gossypium stocksii TaxID=47602 RepID=A0A9D3V3D4_9ROSI|nr:hypothetical protein J1N35_032443 [Gossypium stocksii]